VAAVGNVVKYTCMIFCSLSEVQHSSKIAMSDQHLALMKNCRGDG